VDRKDVRTLFEYNRWANRRLLAAAAKLPADDFTRDLGASHGSVQGTLVHMLFAEWLFTQRWRGESPKRRFSVEEFPTVDALSARWSELEREQLAFIDSLSDETLAQRVAYLNFQDQRWEYPLAYMIQHTFNHATYHRGQIASFLRQFGEAPPATDFLVYLDETEDRISAS
jgi:uncharacterized damage-inducible protein DinB